MTNETPTRIDFRRRETEAGWNRIFDAFALTATPVWFSWLGWILTLSVFQFLFAKTDSLVVGGLLAASYVMLFWYFQAFFFQVEFIGLPFASDPWIARGVSLAISAALAFAAFTIAWSISEWLLSIRIST